MLTTTLLLVYISSTAFGIYFFDYKTDSVINNPLVISLSIIGGIVIVFIFIIVFLETTYFFIAKRRPTTSRLKHYFGKQIVSVPMHLFRIKTTIYGAENLPKDTKFLIFSNHTSELDVSVLMCHLPQYPVAFLAKQAVNSYLSIGKWAQSIGCVMLNRENNRQGNQAVSQVVENVRKGSTMVVFPEGKVTREIGTLQKFRSGSFKIALASGVPLVPVTLVKEASYYQKKWPRRKHLDIVIHPPLLYASFQDLSSRQLGLQVRDIIASKLNIVEQTKKTD
jgi:1-acyl-sn-glycerol-3-phosphate acyltransferase